MSDDDAPDIPPALSEKEWGDLFAYDRRTTIMIMGADSDKRELSLAGGGHNVRISDADDLAALVALANEMLRRFDDPRAILRGHVTLLREVADAYEHDTAGLDDDRSARVHEFADALESYLPPETPP